MSLINYSVAVLRLATLLFAAVLFARSVRQWLAPSWRGPVSVLADSILGLSYLTVLGELVGSVGLFRRTLLVPLSAAIAVAVWALLRGRRSSPADPTIARTSHRRAVDIAVVTASVALVTAEWMTWVAQRIWTGVGNAGGPADGDTLWYHLPTAALFTTTGWTTHLPFLNAEALVTYYPANTPLLHALGFLAMGNDVLSPLLNLALVPLALLAGWVIGEAAGFPSAALASVAVALTMPIVVTSEAGTAKDDMLSFVGLLAAVAFLVRPRPEGQEGGEWAGTLVGGLAAGLALGSKVTFVAPVVVLGVALVVLAGRARRVRTGLLFFVAALISGGYWYLRNLVAVGNPLPGLRIGAFGLHLPVTPTPAFSTYFGGTLLHVLGNTFLWRKSLLPGLSLGMGAAWPLILAVIAAATVAGLLVLRGRELLVPITVLGGALAFLITPGVVWAAQLAHKPGISYIIKVQFSYQVRYLLPAIAVALAGVSLVARRWRHGERAVLGAAGLTLLATQLGLGQAPGSAADNWFPGHALPALLVAATAGAAAAWVVGRRNEVRRTSRWIAAALAALAALIAAIGGRALEDYYLHYRYSGLALAVWADHLNGARIGYSGFSFSYPLYGAELQNRVEMIGQHGPNGSYGPVTNCLAWRRDVRRAGLDYVVVPIGGTAGILGIDLGRWLMFQPRSIPPDEPPESHWTRDDPGAKIVLVGEGAAVYRVSGPVTSSGCRDPSAS